MIVTPVRYIPEHHLPNMAGTTTATPPSFRSSSGDGTRRYGEITVYIVSRRVLLRTAGTFLQMEVEMRRAATKKPIEKFGENCR